MTTNPIAADDVDLSDFDFWLLDRDVREAAFKAPPGHAGAALQRRTRAGGLSVPAWSRLLVAGAPRRRLGGQPQPQLFCSGQGSNIVDLPQELNEFFGSMINMDDPKHFRLRSIVSKGFTPKEVARVEEYVKVKAAAVVDDMLEQHPDRQCDFVEAIAAPMPLQIICDMMGIPDDESKQVFHWTNVILGAGDPEFGGSYEALMNAGLEMFTYAQALGEDRRANPTDDITSVLMQAEVDGEQLTTQEFGSFFILLVVAGNETTRNAISHGMKALTDTPDQRERWWNDWDGVTKTAVEEIVRWASPVIHFRRTATADTELERPADRRRREGGALVQLGQPRRAGVRRPVSLRRDPPAAAGAGRLRSRWSALLPRRQPRPPRDRRDVRRDPSPRADAAHRPASRPTCRASSSTGSSGCRAPGECGARQPRPRSVRYDVGVADSSIGSPSGDSRYHTSPTP